jgi:hypothetical protein
MTPTLLALLLLAGPQTPTAAAPMEYADAKHLADADEAAVKGAAKETLLAAQAALLDAGVAECSRFDLRGDVTPFVVVMRLDAKGRVQQTWRQGSSPLAICLQRYVRDKTLVTPPKAPFHTALEISFGK